MSAGMGSPLSEPALHAVLRGYGLVPRDDDPPRVVTGRVIHLPQTAGGLAIKVFPREQSAEAHIESSLLAHLGEGEGERERERGGAGEREGYRVQPLRRTTTGAVLLALDDRRVLVTRWVQGRHRSYREVDLAGWAALGRTLAALHRRLDDAPPLVLCRFVDALRRRDLAHDRGTLAEHRARVAASTHPQAPLLLRMLDDRAVLLELHADRCLAALPIAGERPIHNDYNVHNVLFHDRGPPTILDWERAILAPRELEVCRCLAHLPIVAPASAWAFVDGYLERGTLDPERVPWAVHACLTLHAVKHWPVAPWLAGAPGAVERIAGMAEIVRAFVEGQAPLHAFTTALCARIHAHRSP